MQKYPYISFPTLLIKQPTYFAHVTMCSGETELRVNIKDR